MNALPFAAHFDSTNLWDGITAPVDPCPNVKDMHDASLAMAAELGHAPAASLASSRRGPDIDETGLAKCRLYIEALWERVLTRGYPQNKSLSRGT